MTLLTFALLSTPAVGQSKPTMPVWPSISRGTVWVSRGVATKSPHTADSPTRVDGHWVATLSPPAAGPAERAAIEVLALVQGDGPVVKIGDVTVQFKAEKLSMDPVGAFVPAPTAKFGHPLDVTVLTRYNDVAIYVNGELFTSFGTAKSTKITYLRGDWKESLQGLATFPHAVSPAQVARNAQAAADFVHGIASGPPLATVDLQLGVFTPVPDPNRIKPYRNALLAQEYKVLDVVDAGSTSLRAGQTVRVFRYGVLEGKQTALKDLKSGARVRLKIEPMSVASPTVQNEYQLDSLDTAFGAYYVEVIQS